MPREYCCLNSSQVLVRTPFQEAAQQWLHWELLLVGIGRLPHPLDFLAQVALGTHFYQERMQGKYILQTANPDCYPRD